MLPLVRSTLAPARLPLSALLGVLLLLAACAGGEIDSPTETSAPEAAESVSASPPADEATEPEPVDDVFGNRIKWSTASEVENFGYDIYRGDSEEGPFERLTADPLPGAGTTDEPSYYDFVDETIEPGERYWYYVESISLGGERERFTPVFQSKAKWPAGQEPAADLPADDAEVDDAG